MMVRRSSEASVNRPPLRQVAGEDRERRELLRVGERLEREIGAEADRHAVQAGLEHAVLQQGVSDPGLLFGADVGDAADAVGRLSGECAVGVAVGQGGAAAAEDLLEQGWLGVEMNRVSLAMAMLIGPLRSGGTLRFLPLLGSSGMEISGSSKS